MNIEKFKENLDRRKISGLALDIDETLSWTLGYWAKEMMKLFGNPENLSVEDLIAKYKYSQNVPYWQTEEAHKWMEEQRESNELQIAFDLIEGAQESVRQIDSIVPIVGYITVRPVSIIDGTRRWLEKHNFPKADILARPPEIQHSDGNKWKAEVLASLYPQVAGIVDDNPKLIEYLPSDYKGVIYLFGSEEYLQDSNLNVIPCKNWKEVIERATQTSPTLSSSPTH